MTKDKRESILRKVKACFALAEGAGTEAEAEAAMARARDLMAKYHLSRVEVEDFDADRDKLRAYAVEQTDSRPLEIAAVMGVINTLFPVEMFEQYAEKTSGFTYSRRYVVFGSEADAEVAANAYVYLRRTFRNLWDQARPRIGAILGRDPGRPDMRAYYDGVGHGIVNAAKSRERQKESDCTALIRTDQMVKEEFHKRFQMETMKQAPEGSAAARMMGYYDGTTVSVNPGLPENTQERIGE